MLTDYEHCENCGGRLPKGHRWGSLYCSKACRQAAYRKRKSGTVTFTGKRRRGMIK